MKKIILPLLVFCMVCVGLLPMCKKENDHQISISFDMPHDQDTILIGHPLMAKVNVIPVNGSEVSLTLEGTDKVVLTDTPYVYQWNTRNMEEGKYLLTAEVRDNDGNISQGEVEIWLLYPSVTIGNQVWMKENLKRTYYSDGTPIVGAFAYGDDSSNVATYGLLYTWDAVMHGEKATDENPSGVQGACPVGWHVPSRAEFTEMVNYLGGPDVAGGKMKEAGYDHWASPNDGATNSSGFTGLGGGERKVDGTYDRLLRNAGFWTCTENDLSSAYYQCLTAIHPITRQWTDSKKYGYSLRCVKNKDDQ